MTKNRLEAFSDGVIAIIITIMVLELNVPSGHELRDLRPLVPVAVYGVVLTLAAVAYYLLSRSLVKHHGDESPLARALGADFKGRISIVLYLVAIAAAFASPWISVAIYTFVALMWVVPDRRIEDILTGEHRGT